MDQLAYLNALQLLLHLFPKYFHHDDFHQFKLPFYDDEPLEQGVVYKMEQEKIRMNVKLGLELELVEVNNVKLELKMHHHDDIDDVFSKMNLLH